MTTDETLIKICERYTLIGVKKLLLRNEREGCDREIVRCFLFWIFWVFLWGVRCRENKREFR